MCKPFGPAQWQLFNLQQDPGETRDLASEHNDIHDKMVKHWDEYVQANSIIIPGASLSCKQN
jgi:arylsulfatase